MSQNMTRRHFTKTAAASGALASSIGWSAVRADAVPGANDRVRIGILGVGNRGGQLLHAFQEHADTQIVAICDVYQPYLAKTAAQLGGDVATYRDFRKLIDRSDIDAVIIATPDHWHAVQTILACRSGKDVYVEKPLSITIHEGRRMVEVARETERVVQVGTHRRSSPLWARVAAMVQAGDLGKVTVSRACRLSNMTPHGIGKRTPTTPPNDLDWDMWLGPRPDRAYQDNMAPYKFRWWQLYSSQMANWGVHYLDAIRWCIGEVGPASICALGGRFAVDDDRTIPDTAEALFQFPTGHLAIFSTFEANGNPLLRRGELELRGTRGTASIGGSELVVEPEKGGQFQDRAPRMEPLRTTLQQSSHAETAAHARNFLDCVKSRQRPSADIEIGHRSTTLALLANLSLATRQRLEWDVEKERITSPEDANQLLHYEYRPPWTLD